MWISTVLSVFPQWFIIWMKKNLLQVNNLWRFTVYLATFSSCVGFFIVSILCLFTWMFFFGHSRVLIFIDFFFSRCNGVENLLTVKIFRAQKFVFSATRFCGLIYFLVRKSYRRCYVKLIFRKLFRCRIK